MTIRAPHLRLALVCSLCSTAVFGCADKRGDSTNAPAATQAPETLAGVTYRGTVAPVGSKGGDPDELVFDGASFESTACRGLGFGATSYTEAKDGEAIAFEAIAPNDNGATMHWRGLAHGDEIDATAQWSKPGEPSKQYRFVGQRVR